MLFVACSLPAFCTAEQRHLQLICQDLIVDLCCRQLQDAVAAQSEAAGAQFAVQRQDLADLQQQARQIGGCSFANLSRCIVLDVEPSIWKASCCQGPFALLALSHGLPQL